MKAIIPKLPQAFIDARKRYDTIEVAIRKQRKLGSEVSLAVWKLGLAHNRVLYAQASGSDHDIQKIHEALDEVEKELTTADWERGKSAQDKSRESVRLIELVLEEGNLLIAKEKIQNAKVLYKQLLGLFQKLPAEQKKEVLPRCNEFRAKLSQALRNARAQH